MKKDLQTLTPAQFAFLKWLHDTHPQLADAAEQRRSSINGFMDSITSTFNDVLAKAPDLMNQYVKSKTDLETLKLNIARAKAGQAPVSSASFVPQSVSQVPGWAWAAGGAIVLYLFIGRRK